MAWILDSFDLSSYDSGSRKRYTPLLMSVGDGCNFGSHSTWGQMDSSGEGLPREYRGVEGNYGLCLVVSEAHSEPNQRTEIKLFPQKAPFWMLTGLCIHFFDGFDFAKHNENQ